MQNSHYFDDMSSLLRMSLFNFDDDLNCWTALQLVYQHSWLWGRRGISPNILESLALPVDQAIVIGGHTSLWPKHNSGQL